MKYWLIIETIPGLDHKPYSLGLIDEENPSPEGAKEFKNKADLEKAIKEVDSSKKSKLPVADEKEIQKVFDEIKAEDSK